MNYTAVLNSVPQPDYKELVLSKYQSTKDIIADLIHCFKIYNYQAKDTYKQFYTGNITNDGKNVWDFIRNNITYDAEPFKNQTTRSFSRILHDKHGDCKHSALLAASLGWQMSYNVIFRFVDYTGDGYGHVYVILQDPVTKKTVIIDPLQDFNYEKSYKKKKDYIAQQLNNKDMTLSRLSGTGQMMPVDTAIIQAVDSIGYRQITMTPILTDQQYAELAFYQGDGKVGKFGDGFKRAIAKVKNVADKVESKVKTTVNKVESKVKTVVNKAEEVVKDKVIPGVKKIYLSPVRLAFDGLLLLNFRDFAGRIKKAMGVNENAIKTFATNFGWDYDKFKANVDKGSVKPALFGGTTNGIYESNGIGIVLDSAAIASASAAILAIIPILKSLGFGHSSDDTTTKQAADNTAKLPDVTGTGTAGDILTNSPPTNTNSFFGMSADSGLVQKIKDHPVPVLILSAGVIYFAGKAFKIIK